MQWVFIRRSLNNLILSQTFMINQFHAQQRAADAFLEAYRRCNPEQELDDPDLMALPAIVCAAFSIEVGLKTILKKCGLDKSNYGKNGHDLYYLYNKLPKNIQEQIQEATLINKTIFIEKLVSSRLAFIDWRYFYENEKLLTQDVIFLGLMASVVQTIYTKDP